MQPVGVELLTVVVYGLNCLVRMEYCIKGPDL